jgi:nucleotidyltransferase/DNA polymerase involved in DNA repair
MQETSEEGQGNERDQACEESQACGEVELTTREVNDIIASHDIDPEALREFAWEIVKQDLVGGLSRVSAVATVELGIRIRVLVRAVEDELVQLLGEFGGREVLKSVLRGLREEIVSSEHKKRVKPREFFGK